MLVLKGVTLLLVWTLLFFFIVTLGWSMLLGQAAGMFWYGVGTIVAGLGFKYSLNWFMEE